MALSTIPYRLIRSSCRVLPIITQNNYKQIHRWVMPTLKLLKHREQKQGGKKINPRNTFLEWNQEAEVYAFGKRLNETFDETLLSTAFTDRSYVIKEEARQKELGVEIDITDNRELASEGENFINDYVMRYLEVALPRYPIDGIKAIQSHLTSEETLSNVALQLGTKDIILADEYPVSKSILANTFKAIVGALIHSSDETRTAHFIRDFLITRLNGVDVNDYYHIEDPWSTLQEIMRKGGSEVEARLIGEVGRNTLLACYRVGLYIDKKMISSGFGETVTNAKEIASREALKKLYGTSDSMPPINFKLEGTLRDRTRNITSN